jgi:hypothetical protein
MLHSFMACVTSAFVRRWQCVSLTTYLAALLMPGLCAHPRRLACIILSRARPCTRVRQGSCAHGSNDHDKGSMSMTVYRPVCWLIKT